MNEKKKSIVLLSVAAFIILLIVVGSLYESHKSKKYLNEFYSALNGSESSLVMIGRDNCSWCQLFHPSLDYMSKNYGFDFLYVDTNKLTSSNFNRLLESVNVDEKDFGTPLSVVVKDGGVVDSINGYVDETALLNFLKKHNFVSSDAKLPLNYIDYSGYKKILRSSDSSILVLGQTTCQYCIKAKPILNQIITDYGIKINYLNINELSEDDLSKFKTSLDYLSDNKWGTPLTLIIENGKVIDSANGLLDYDGYVKLFTDNGFIK